MHVTIVTSVAHDEATGEWGWSGVGQSGKSTFRTNGRLLECPADRTEACIMAAANALHRALVAEKVMPGDHVLLGLDDIDAVIDLTVYPAVRKERDILARAARAFASWQDRYDIGIEFRHTRALGRERWMRNACEVMAQAPLSSGRMT